MAVSVYHLPLEEHDVSPPPPRALDVALPRGQLLRNLRWFIQLRFLTVAFLLAAGGAYELAEPFFVRQGIRLHHLWPLWMGITIGIANLAFLRQSRSVATTNSAPAVRTALRVQIVLDMACLIVAVHFLGSLTSFAPFVFLFHIVLSCIFFPRKESFLVVLLACILFIGCVLLEQLGLVPPAGIFAGSVRPASGTMPPFVVFAHVVSALAIWLTIWYVASRVSRTTRQRDLQLAGANKRLIRANQDRIAHMLRTTHEIKAPFAAIHANTQVLLKGYCGTLPERAVNIVERIEQRCRRLSDEIKQMLQLANLQSKAQEAPPITTIDLKEALGQCLAQAEDLALEHDTSLDTDLRSVAVQANQDHLHMMFENLISNAIAYSHRGGSVRIGCRERTDAVAEVTIQDQGIGIPADKLPKIFEDYYRTQEAVNHNKSSTGLGLAVVRRIAQRYGLRIAVRTELDRGTTFTVVFPRAP